MKSWRGAEPTPAGLHADSLSHDSLRRRCRAMTPLQSCDASNVHIAERTGGRTPPLILAPSHESGRAVHNAHASCRCVERNRASA